MLDNKQKILYRAKHKANLKAKFQNQKEGTEMRLN